MDRIRRALMSMPFKTGLIRRGPVALFALGSCLSLLLLARSQTGGDQLNLLARGWLLASHGELVPYGNPTSGGGVSPGPMTSVVVALPLFVWMNARAPAVLILLTHVFALFLLDRLVARAWGGAARLAFALLYGLSPLRLALSALLWNPSYLFLAGALHAVTAYRQRHEARAFDSFVHALILGLAVQLHLSAVILGVASALLVWRSAMKVNWGGAIAGASVAAATLVPYLQVLVGPGLDLPAREGFLGRGLLLFYPLVHGVWNQVRLAALSLPAKLTLFDFTALLGPSGDAVLTPVALGLARWIAPATLLLALCAFWRWIERRRRGHALRPGAPSRSSRNWLHGYAVSCFAGALVSFALAPTTPMWWQGVVILHAAVLPATDQFALWLRSRHRARARRVLLSWAAVSVVLTLLMAFGSPPFRCGGRDGVNLTLAEHYPMLDELGLERQCPFPIERGGWWPDLFPPAGDGKE